MKKMSCNLLLISVILITAISCKTYKANCPPKLKVYKNLEDAFPVYAGHFQITLNNCLNYIDAIDDSFEAELKRDIVKLRQDLEQYNLRVKAITKSNYSDYRDGICDENIRMEFTKFRIKLTRVTEKIAELKFSLEDHASSFRTDSQKINEAKKKLEEAKSIIFVK